MGQLGVDSPLRVGVAGLGTVAQALIALLRENSTRVSSQSGREIHVTHVASRSAKPDVDLGPAAFSTDIRSLVDRDIDVLVELIGGVDDAYDLICEGLRHDISVVTANKAVLAAHGNEILALASNRNCRVGFEASVAGGIPIINTLNTALASNQVKFVAGIINGTCNYILTAMDESGTTFNDALSDAQVKGYAEADPTFDIEGIDAAQKLAILAAMSFDTTIDLNGVHTEGISSIEVEDLRYARELGFRIKHLGIAEKNSHDLDTRVHLALVPESNLLSNVRGVDNAVIVGANAVENLMLVGPGAGGRATASAVLADIIEIANGSGAVPNISRSDSAYSSISDVSCPHYLYIPAADKPGVIATIGEVLGTHGVSIESVIQKHEATRINNGVPWVPVVIVTNSVLESNIESIVTELEGLEIVRGNIRRIRVVDF